MGGVPALSIDAKIGLFAAYVLNGLPMG